jgi:hypothetical protein
MPREKDLHLIAFAGAASHHVTTRGTVKMEIDEPGRKYPVSEVSWVLI